MNINKLKKAFNKHVIIKDDSNNRYIGLLYNKTDWHWFKIINNNDVEFDHTYFTKSQSKLSHQLHKNEVNNKIKIKLNKINDHG